MNPACLILIIVLLGVSSPIGQAQITVPATAKKFVTRKNGSSTGSGSSVGLVSPAKKRAPQIIIYTTLTKVREWESSDGKTMQARLLAFPSLTENTTNKNPHHTVIRDQKVRFLMSPNNKAIIYPLEKLSDFDQEFIEEIAQAAAKAAKAHSSKQENTVKDTSTQTEKPSVKKK